MSNENVLKEIGARIKKRRKELHITQEQLAEKMDVSIQMISNLEQGKKAIRPENLINLCASLKISSDSILLGKRSDGEVLDYLNKYKLLNTEDQMLIENLTNRLLNSNED